MSEMGMAMMGSATISGENRAVEATRQAISSPLLEDVNLHGAKGLLVNITAGPDMSIGEFEAVGNAIHEYAAEDANVVIGTAFDPGMQGDLRVTMVATGLVDTRVRASAPQPVEPVKVAPVAAVPAPEHEGEVEQVARRQAIGGRRYASGGTVAERSGGNMDHLDIPAFLRKQAD
jgi:cell division protein FtsZ